ncbi:unnamed protein product [Spirodela intermedia]|uniref:Uncharacterized protein n=1 Tax=Spirodela intermedia TaxID=51605 RepID=A0A7I8KXI6_SPIIN|nr:unnamed protein product [Spirodela intermedia]
MDNLRDLVANIEFLGRKHVDLRMRPNMVSGLDNQPTSKESNNGQTGNDIGWRWCPLFVGEWGEAQEYLGRHHAMSRMHHNYYASSDRVGGQSSLFGRTCPSKPKVLIDLSDSAYLLYACTALHYRPLHGLSQATTMTSSWHSSHTTDVECTLPISTRRIRHIVIHSNIWPYVVEETYDYGIVMIKDLKSDHNFKVNGQRLKHYIEHERLAEKEILLLKEIQE